MRALGVAVKAKKDRFGSSRLHAVRYKQAIETYIAKAFEPYYGRTVAPPTDPNLLFDTRSRLDQYDVLRTDEVEEAVAVLLTIADAKDHGRLYALLDPACERFKDLDEQDRLGFKDALDKFVRTYAFLSQVVSFGDSKLERDYIFCRALPHGYATRTQVPRWTWGRRWN